MKKLFILLFISLHCFSQDKLVVYNFKLLNDDKILKSEIIGEMYKKSMEASKHIKLNLEFNDTIAKFKMEENMNLESSDFIMTNALCNCQEAKYIYKNKLYRNNTEGLIKKNEYIIIDSLETNWTFHNESKQIDGFECYKATSETIVINSKGEFRHPLIAWYCPQLPYPFGPSGYGGLPGLILELQDWNNVFGVEKIVLNHIIEEPIKLPTKGKVITYKDYNIKIGELSKERFNYKE